VKLAGLWPFVSRASRASGCLGAGAPAHGRNRDGVLRCDGLGREAPRDLAQGLVVAASGLTCEVLAGSAVAAAWSAKSPSGDYNPEGTLFV